MNVPKRVSIQGSQGMSLVELMIAIAVTGVVMTLSLAIFTDQTRNFKKGQETKEIQETNTECLDFLKRELAQAGWSVKPEMAFYFNDGGDSGSDNITINDTTLIDLDSQNGTRLMTEGTGWGGCAKFSISAAGQITVSGPDFDINEDGKDDYNVNSFVISDGEGNKVARIIDKKPPSTLELNGDLDGEYVAPAVYYCASTCDVGGQSLPCLRRSDRSSGGKQPFAANVVDLQAAYRDRAGNWYGVSGCSGAGVGPNGSISYCSMSPLDPNVINLVRITMITRSTDPVGERNSARYCRPAAENRSGAALNSNECGFVYRSYTITIRPRHTAN